MRSTTKRPVLDRLSGKTTLQWISSDGHQLDHTARLRFTDYEGKWPSLYSVLHLPSIISSYIQHKRSPLIANPVPFLVIDAIRFLNKNIRPGMRVAEFGAGNSTLWFLKHAVKLTTYESDPAWNSMIIDHLKVKPEMSYPGKLELKEIKGQDAIDDFKKYPDHYFDIVLVDSGNAHTSRIACMEAAVTKVKPGGWLILDNSDSPLNKVAHSSLINRECIRFTGYSVMSLFVCQTTFWRM